MNHKVTVWAVSAALVATIAGCNWCHATDPGTTGSQPPSAQKPKQVTTPDGEVMWVVAEWDVMERVSRQRVHNHQGTYHHHHDANNSVHAPDDLMAEPCPYLVHQPCQSEPPSQCARHDGDVTKEDAENIMQKATAAGASERILIGGDATVTLPAAEVFAGSGILLLGNESQTVGPLMAPKDVHLVLLGKEITLLEGIVLKDVKEGKYFLSAAPLNLGGCDGAPCRAYLIRN